MSVQSGVVLGLRIGYILTYFNNGRNVMDHTIALIAPIASSFGGAGPSAGQIPFRTYRGEVPMSE